MGLTPPLPGLPGGAEIPEAEVGMGLLWVVSAVEGNTAPNPVSELLWTCAGREARGAMGAGPEGCEAREDGPLPESAPDRGDGCFKSVKKSFLS